MVSDRFVVPFILTAVYFLAGCTGEDGNANSAVSRSMVTNPSPTSTNQGNSNDSNLEPDVILTEELRLGKETQFQLTFPGGYSCTDGVNQVTWRLIGGAERISIQNTDRCQPVISTTSLFEGGDASLEADLVATDGRKIRWTTSIGFQEAPEIIFADSDFVQTESEWLTASGDTLGTSAMDCLPSASNCQTGRLYLGTWRGYGGVVAMEGSAASRNIQPVFTINNINIEAQNSVPSELIVTATCRMEDPNYQHILEACPFDFDPILPTDRSLRFRLSLDSNQSRAAFRDFPIDRKRFKNVYRAGFHWGSYATRPLIVEIQVRHRRTSSMATKIVGRLVQIVTPH